MKDKKVLNFGSLNIDYTYTVNHFVRAGETISSKGLQRYSGGKGLNQSVALGRSGADVWHAGAVGSDGQFLIEELQHAGVHTEYIRTVKESTGHAIIQKTELGENGILLYGGANQKITKAQINETLEYFGEGDFLILQNEISEMIYLMEQGYRKGMRIVFTPAPMNERVREYPIANAEYLILNETEAEGFCGEGSSQEVMRKLSERFPSVKIILTLGEQGAWYRYGKETYFQKIVKVPIVDTTAAGDTFTGYFVGAVIRGMEVWQAMAVAAMAGAIAVSRPGAAPSIPVWDEVKIFSD